jgi:hypothetical protein
MNINCTQRKTLKQLKNGYKFGTEQMQAFITNFILSTDSHIIL